MRLIVGIMLTPSALPTCAPTMRFKIMTHAMWWSGMCISKQSITAAQAAA
jgi:hypothetical protein